MAVVVILHMTLVPFVQATSLRGGGSNLRLLALRGCSVRWEIAVEQSKIEANAGIISLSFTSWLAHVFALASLVFTTGAQCFPWQRI
jgi:hypothetical protein